MRTLSAVRAKTIVLSLLVASASLTDAIAAPASCERLEEWVPADVVAYLRVEGLGAALERWLGSKLRRDYDASAAGKLLAADEKYRNFLAELERFERTGGRRALDVVQDLLGEEVLVAARWTIIGIPEVLVLSRVKSAEHLARAREALERAVVERHGALPPTAKREHLGHTVETLGQAHFSSLGSVLAVSNSPAFLASAIDLAEKKGGRPLCESALFAKAAREARPGDLARLVIQPRLVPGFKVPQQMDEAFPGLLFGGFAGALRQSEAIVVSLALDGDGAALRAAAIAAAGALDAKFDAFFPQVVPSAVEERLRERGVLGFITVHRDLAKFWERGEELLEPRAAGSLSEFASNLSLFFGKSFEDEVLPGVGDRMLFVAHNQSYAAAGGKPVPAIPGLAIVFELDDAAGLSRAAEVAFNSVVGIINIDRMQKKKEAPSMLVRPVTVGSTACYTVDLGLAPAPSTGRGIEYNFTPSLAIVGRRLVLSSSFELLEFLVAELERAGKEEAPAAGAAAAPTEPARDRIVFDARAARQAIADNAEFFAAQNMIKKGITREKAREEIDALLDLAGFLREVEVLSYRDADGATLRLEVRVRLAHDTGADAKPAAGVKTASAAGGSR